MIPSTFTNLPLFSFTLYACMVALVTLVYRDQKYVLFKKLPDGRIRKVETFTEPITREDAISRYGDDRYMLQSMKPRTKTLWKDLSGSYKDGNVKNEVHLVALQPLERKTKYLATGLVGLGVGTGIGFVATTIGHMNHSQLLNRAAIAIDSLTASYPIPGFQCTICKAQLVSVFDKFCNQCGYPITSPDRRQLASPSEQRCPHCSFPVSPGQLYCRECGKPLQNQLPRIGWSLP